MTTFREQSAEITCYEDAVRWIYERIDYERIRPLRTSGHFRLERVEKLLAVIDSPQQRIPAIHIAGTKGKGTTAAVMSSILTASGIRHGLFTSPHIHVFEERMQINGRMPSQAELTALVAELQDRLARAEPDLVEDGPTYFEVATLLAWMFFDQQQVELAVLETGLGGRLDTTNVCRSVVTIITSIGLDHTHILGDTVELIAAEKAGILKPQIPVLTWVHQPGVQQVIREKAAQKNCVVYWRDLDLKASAHLVAGQLTQTIDVTTPVRKHTGLKLPLLGEHQAGNAALAISAADLLAQTEPRITMASIAAGVAQTEWPLRFEIFPGRPSFILDAAHNPDSIAAFTHTFRHNFPDQNALLIFASSQDKDARRMLEIVSGYFSKIVLTKFCTNPRAFEPQALQHMLQELELRKQGQTEPEVWLADDPEHALQLARQHTSDSDIVCVTGSIFVAAELRSLLLRK